MTQVHRPALSQYWWATHLRQLRSTFAPTRKEANDNGQFEKQVAHRDRIAGGPDRKASPIRSDARLSPSRPAWFSLR
jgi:hypothetical protein